MPTELPLVSGEGIPTFEVIDRGMSPEPAHRWLRASL
jgi:hypothetical protein